jgi:hypothetical protein
LYDLMGNGGLPDVKYVIDMDIVFIIDDDLALHNKSHIHQFIAKTGRLTLIIIDTAYESFKKKFQLGSWYEDDVTIAQKYHKLSAKK